MGGTAQAQARDSANRFTRTTPDPDATPHPCERLARTFTGEPSTTATIAPPTQKRMRNPRMVYAAAEHLIARKIDLDTDFAGNEDRGEASDGFSPDGRARSAGAIMRDGLLRQHKAHKRGDVHLGPPSTLVPDYADDAFAVALAGRITGFPAELLWARWAAMDCRVLGATWTWRRLVAAGEIDTTLPWQRGARHAVLHGVTRSLYGKRYTRSYANAARFAVMNALEFTRISKLAEQEIRTALAVLERAFLNARFGNDLPTELALNI